ncbi:hypothetical protein A2697_00560 [Candidatus Curtissbacteria bacterium RIFCSPHIGHO2_01_FULL_41_44]|uniref:Glycosyltransferase RgtA/B/C/D-like domain-containing protein n=1 Tax=Candidatus Curtissbacteria bacterium RIFCSPLOWO2_01_FULL_42_50 TaxID=1797730 RepID=A0A1F5H5M7_9BACT|nr:MAG: hypothetical protein A2697_00560 [Candidatus Curtissbacteria bacterium RIFCSPHIGHO2_01_FULL_41_44]OGD96714.1 MAG: hypothetical protein A3E71_01285 [Candidatus Curtissbacteria bacterium RIFCSPHIGHO2_12_FULL_42_33]OGD99369.1 MAG: hypothetical protein A3B54_04515 [Candidatus Curtissbacteria bacterium RIFCSPLOWO2_01_FULL_42_50]OGE02416.1 MAG: hypothetical protein A3G16_05230 [Candidatus Curtissbacteria bacterium RIFCSPLOWO2_12_FULL_41_16]
MKNKIIVIVFFILTVVLLGLVVKGQSGNPIYFQNEKDTRVGGPFESSNNTSRFALVEAIVEEKTFFFNEKRARFSSPDLVLYNDKFFSIFTPGVSFVGIPFYIFGKSIGAPQLSTYLVNVIAALVNVFLIYKISKKLGAGTFTALLSGVIFLFATNALSYAFTFTQHHLSTLAILAGTLAVIGKSTFVKNVAVGIAFGVAILMDIPNLFLFLPIIIYALVKNIGFGQIKEKVSFSFNLKIFGLIAGLIPFLFVFALYNYQLTGSYTKIGQLIGRTSYPPKEVAEQKPNSSQYTSSDLKLFDTPFNPRRELNGFYILLISNERGIFYYSPVLILGLVGLLVSINSKKRKRQEVVILVSSISLTNILLYSMFGDPWGGWSYGPRYLIPTAAILSLGIGPAFHKFKKKLPIIILAFFIIAYSVSVNALGALTTAAVPPKGEAQNLASPIPYTFQYNLQLLEKNFSSSLVYNLYFFNLISAKYYLIYYIAVVSLLIFMLGVGSYKEKEEKIDEN